MIPHPPIVQIDEFARTLRPVSFAQAHPKDRNKQGLRHPSTHIFIFKDNSLSELLKQKRVSNLPGGGKWDSSAGGHVDWIPEENKAELPSKTAYRELEEELFYNKNLPENLELKEVKTFWKHLRPNDHEYISLFEGIYSGPFFPNPSEVSQVKFNTLEFLLEDFNSNSDLYTNSFKFCIEKYLENR